MRAGPTSSIWAGRTDPAGPRRAGHVGDPKEPRQDRQAPLERDAPARPRAVGPRSWGLPPGARCGRSCTRCWCMDPGSSSSSTKIQRRTTGWSPRSWSVCPRPSGAARLRFATAARPRRIRDRRRLCRSSPSTATAVTRSGRLPPGTGSCSPTTCCSARRQPDRPSTRTPSSSRTSPAAWRSTSPALVVRTVSCTCSTTSTRHAV